MVKRERIEVEDETKKIVEVSDKGGIASANGNNGENMASDNAFVLNECHLRTNTSLSSRSIETEVAYRVMKFPCLPLNDVTGLKKLCLHLLQRL